MTQTATTITVDSLPIANSIDPVQDRVLIYTASATDIQGISRNVYLGLSSQPVGISDSQTLTNKVLGNTNTLTLKASNFTLQDGTDTTKQANFVLSGITTGTTRNYTLPNVSDTLVSLTATQTLTNKTLTSPTISGGSIDNSSITVDTISGHTTSGTGTVYGLNIVSGVLNTNNSVVTSNISAGAVTAAQMQYGMVRYRQGGTTGAGSWLSTGTSNTNTSTTSVFTQVGSNAATAQTTSITFPTSFTQVPIVSVTPSGSGGVFSAGWYTVNETTTGFQFVAADYTKVTAIKWIAIGQ